MKTIKIKNITFIHGDCMEFLKDQKENAFDLAIVDPPYGIGVSSQNNNKRGKKGSHYKKKDWDNKTETVDFFNKLLFVSDNSIIWGANHFIDKIARASSCWLVWDKKTVGNTADCELAFTTFKTAVRKFSFLWEGFWQQDMKNKEHRIHPTQKPVKLYEWLLMNYAKPGQTILDTHGGSGSIAIACNNLGFELTIIEKDKEYFDNMIKRFKEQTAQQRLFKGV